MYRCRGSADRAGQVRGNAGAAVPRPHDLDVADTQERARLAVDGVRPEEGVNWLYSFLSADRRQSYCLYEAPSPDELIAAARRAGIPADVIVEVNQVSPEMVA